MKVPVRFYRLYLETDPFKGFGTDYNREQDFHYVEDELVIPVGQAALVLVDCWNTGNDWREDIKREKILPVVKAARKAGLAVLHAPTERVARKYPRSEKYFEPGDGEQPTSYASPDPDWPPEQFVKREGEYAGYVRNYHPSGWKDHFSLAIADILTPEGGDYVVRSGNHLHKICKRLRILHLFYAGFAANICVVRRDYGMVAMGSRGYNTILLRDCTGALEYHDTQKKHESTMIAVREIETQYAFSTVSRELINAMEDQS